MENKSKPDMVFEFSSLLNKELLSSPSTPTNEEQQNDITPDNTSRPVSPEEYVIDIEEHMEKKRGDESSDEQINEANEPDEPGDAEDSSLASNEPDEPVDSPYEPDCSVEHSYADVGANEPTLSGTEVCTDVGANAEANAEANEQDYSVEQSYADVGANEPVTPTEPQKCLIMTQNVDLKKSYCYDVLTLDSKPSKWQSVLRYLKSTKDWESYKYLWIIDSNVAFTDDQICTFLKNVSSIETGIFQPSVLVSTEHPSIHNYPVLLHDQECSMALKPVKFIENKIPCFTTDIVKESVLPFLIQNEKFLHSGWGIDMWWATKHPNTLYVVNDVQVVNNIPPNLIDKKTGAKEMIHFIRKYKLSVNVLA